MEKNENNQKVVFYGPLPVSKPYPIVKPSDRIQLQPTVHPVAITPFIAMEGEEHNSEAEAANAETPATEKKEKRLSARIGGLVIIFIVIASMAFLIVSMFKNYPVAAIEKYASLSYFYELYEFMFATKQFANFELVFVPYLIAVAYLAMVVNLVKALIAVITGRRMGYTLFAFISFVTLVVASFYQMKFFSHIKDIGNLLSYPYGWPCIMLIIIGFANLIFAMISNLICPKHKIVESVEF